MDWIAIVSAVVSLLSRLTTLLANRRLIDAGSAAAISRSLRQTLDNVDLARRVADAITNPTGDGDRNYADRVRQRFERPGE